MAKKKASKQTAVATAAPRSGPPSPHPGGYPAAPKRSIEDEHRERVKQLVADANSLARLFYQMHGNVVPDDFKFYNATHPQEVGCWNLAVVAYEYIQGDDVNDALNEHLEYEAEGT